MTDNRTLFIFPGQGSQYAGIGADLHDQWPCVKKIYEQASDTLGYDIAKLSFDGSDDIHLTKYTQPVLLTHSIACLTVYQQQSGSPITPVATGGHSLGEYSALVAAGVLSFESALKLVKKRGELMGDLGEGEMMALQLDINSVQTLASTYHAAVAACNLPEQTVVGGTPEDLNALEEALRELYPKKNSVRLKTEGAFHTYFMTAAAREFRPVLAAADFSPGEVRVLANYSGDFHDDRADSIRSSLFWQLFHPVLWHRNLLTAHESGLDAIIEFGGGIGKGDEPASKKPNLAAIIKRAYRGLDNVPKYQAVINNETLSSALETQNT